MSKKSNISLTNLPMIGQELSHFLSVLQQLHRYFLPIKHSTALRHVIQTTSFSQFTDLLLKIKHSLHHWHTQCRQWLTTSLTKEDTTAIVALQNALHEIEILQESLLTILFEPISKLDKNDWNIPELEQALVNLGKASQQ